MGFQMIPVARTEILRSLSQGMVDAVYESPIAVGSTQVFGLARNMASINIAPFMGGVVLNQRTWNLIPDRFKAELIEATRRIERELDQQIIALENEMIRTMGDHGLIVNQLTPAQEQLWYAEIGRVMPNLVGTLFDRSIYERIEVILREHRSGR